MSVVPRVAVLVVLQLLVRIIELLGFPRWSLTHTSSPSVTRLSRTFERDGAVSASPSTPPITPSAPSITPRAPPISGLVASGAPPPLGVPPPNVSGPNLGRPAAGPDLRRSGSGNFLVRRESQLVMF